MSRIFNKKKGSLLADVTADEILRHSLSNGEYRDDLDINRDGRVNSFDAAMLKRRTPSNPQQPIRTGGREVIDGGYTKRNDAAVITSDPKEAFDGSDFSNENGENRTTAVTTTSNGSNGVAAAGIGGKFKQIMNDYPVTSKVAIGLTLAGIAYSVYKYQ